MKYLVKLFLYSLLITVAGCAGSSTGTSTGSSAVSKVSGPPNPYQGTYVGTETLKGGSGLNAGDYPLTIKISNSGKITITDVDNISASGQMENNRFRVVRDTPRQIFEGSVSNKTITGVATENIYTGDGTFALKKK